ncbi:MAG: EamA family transporter [Bacteroidales bacterium]|jgi:transporter family protein|nr:EamA family transporter [Bacteroidales bacterium]
MWKYYALASALMAALTAIFAKIGIKNIDSNLAVALRTCVIVVMMWCIVFAFDTASGIKSLTRTNWIFLVLSGITTGLAWLFYFKALAVGDVSRVMPIDKLSIVFTFILSVIILKEPFSWKVLLGVSLIAGGALIIILDRG